MKKLVLSAILFLGLTVTGFSQEKKEKVQKTPEERAQMMTDMINKKLTLTESQKTQIYQINLERTKAMTADKTKDAKVDRSQLKQQAEANENKILAVLNESQKATYQQMKAERMEKAKKHHGGDHKKGPKPDKA